jgi:hypothetical protein
VAFKLHIEIGTEVSIVDAGTIFVLVLSATFLGVIVYLARLSRRTQAETVKHTRAENVTPKETKPRKAA